MMRYLLVLAAALLPLVLADDSALYCFKHDAGKTPGRTWTINHDVTKDVCSTLSSGHIDDSDYGACRVQDFDVKWFKQRCDGNHEHEHKAGKALTPYI